MGWFFGADKEISAVGGVVKEFGTVLDNVFTSDDERLSHEEIKIRLNNAPFEVLGKLATIDATSRNPFQAGWRPFIGWIAGLALAIYFIPQFSVGAFMFVDAYVVTGEVISYPVKADALMELVLALLGLGSLRTIEKLTGKAK